MTQEEFARRIQVTLSTVNRWENGHAAPSHLAWRAIEDLAKRNGADDESSDERLSRLPSHGSSPRPS